MADNKRYYWLKLNEGFFREKEIKKLRKIAGGDTYTIIYLKMLLKSLSNNGVLYFDSVEDSFVSELALDIDEDEENVAITVQYLMSQKILIELNEEEYLLATCAEMVGSETASTRRSRKSRHNKKLLQCNTVATIGNTEIEGEKETEIETEIEIDTEIEREVVSCQQIADLYNDTCVSLPRIKTLSDTRKEAIEEKLKVYSLDNFKTLFTKTEASDFLKGSNERNWTANFDWLMKDDNMAKVLEGNYDNPKKKYSKNQSNRFEQRNYDYEEIEKQFTCNLGNNPELQERAERLRESLTK